MRRYLVIAAIVVVVIAALFIIVDYAGDFISDKAPLTTKALLEKADQEDLAASENIKPRAKSVYHSFSRILQKADSSISKELSDEPKKALADYQSHKTTDHQILIQVLKDSSSKIKKLDKSLQLLAEETFGKNSEPESKSYLDEILDSNPLKFLLVIAMGLSLILVVLMVRGNVQPARGALLLALIWIGFLVINQIAKSDAWAKITTDSSSAPAQPSKPSRAPTTPQTHQYQCASILENPRLVQINENSWSPCIKQTRRYDFISPGWLEFLPHGSNTPIRMETGNFNFQLDRSITVFQIRGKAGTVSFTPQ